MRSMTGFGQASGESERFRMTVTLRGVNHRFLDLSLRLRDELRRQEPALRELIAGRLWRGRVEVSVEVAAFASRQVEVSIDRDVAPNLKALADELRDAGVISGELAFGDLLRLPEVVRLEIRDPDWTANDRHLLLELTTAALDQLIAARELEGEKLVAALEQRLDGLGRLAAELTQRWRKLPGELAASLRRRVSELVDQGPDPDRLAQEVAYLVDRSDVSEELDRLRSHCDHFRSIMSQDGSAGKRLDFLTQEILRELNTIGAKCRDSEMTRRVLDAKGLCEQLREQVQNVE